MKTNTFWTFACAILILAFAQAFGAGQPAPKVAILKPGARYGNCTVVLPAKASVVERYAGEELAAYLGKMAGTTVPVAASRKSGDHGWAVKLVHDPKLGAESYRIKINRPMSEVVIAGGRPRGVLYGVYALLGDQLGCRWYTRDIEVIPSLSAIELPVNLTLSYSPKFEYRATDWGESLDGDWGARNHLNAVCRLQEKHGGGIYFNPFVHTFNRILDAEELFDKHPEYFSMVGGKRIKDNTQLCLTNPDVFNATMTKAREWAAACKGQGIISISQNDWENPCECPACKAINDEEGAPSGSLIRFLNRVGEALEKDFPNVSVETLAYLYSRKPPLRVKPRKNVIVRLCSIEACFSHPLDGCPEKSNVSFMSDLRGWSKLTKRLYIWDYTINYNHFLMPFPNLDVLDKNIRTFLGNGVAGVFEEGASPLWCELGELRSWVLAQLMWRPDMEVDPLIREYVGAVYGPAATQVQEFIDIQREAIKEGGDHVRIFDAPKGKYLSDDILSRCDAKLEEAAKIATDSGDDALIERISGLRMPIWYTRFTLAREPHDVLKQQAANMLETGRKLNITHVGAWGPMFTNYVETLEEFIGRK